MQNPLKTLDSIFGYKNKEEFSRVFVTWSKTIKRLRGTSHRPSVGEKAEYWFSALLHFVPFKEADWKRYGKLDEKARFGYLSRHLIRNANKAGILKVFVDDYIDKKQNWEYAKKYYKFDAEEFKKNHPYNMEALEPLMTASRNEVRHNEAGHNLYITTINLIKATIQKIKDRQEK